MKTGLSQRVFPWSPDMDLFERMSAEFSGDLFFYAVLDPNLWPGLDIFLMEEDTEFLILYPGMPPEKKLFCLPRLAHLKPGSRPAEQLNQFFGNGLGILFASFQPTPLVDLAAHLQKLCVMQTPEGTKYWFRF